MSNRQSTRAATIEKTLQCSECKEIHTIHRRRCRNRKKGHIKDIWCYKCEKMTKHIEQ